MVTQSKSRQKKKGQKQQLLRGYWFIWVGITSCIIILVVFAMPHSTPLRVHPLISPQAITADILLTVTPTPTPTPIPTPTAIPTPVYTGYCLAVPVLMYHHVDVWADAVQKGYTSLTVDRGIFDQQMAYIASHGFTPYFAEDLVNALHTKTGLGGKPIVITLDDGYDDVYSYAFPIVKKYHLKATVFVPSGLLGIKAGANTYYNWGQLHEMLSSGLVSVGNHTWSHYPMGSKGAEKDIYEITTAQKQIQQYTGYTPATFAYPYGTNAGNGFVEKEVAQQGFLGAFSTFSGTYQCDSFIMSLHRTRIGNVAFPYFGIY